MINWLRRWLRALRRRGRHGPDAPGSIDLRGTGPRAGHRKCRRPVGRLVMEEGEEAALLREVCAAVLATGGCDRELAAWCVRMLTEPGAAERAVAAVDRVASAW